MFVAPSREQGVSMCPDSVLAGFGDGTNKQCCVRSDCCAGRQDEKGALFLSAQRSPLDKDLFFQLQFIFILHLETQ